MRIAVVGAGVSGLMAAWLLQKEHDVTVFEAAGRAGGHAHTVCPLGADGPALDTGFIVFNREDYPLFWSLLNSLGVASQPSRMSFSVHSESSGFEYCASPNPMSLFAQRRNAVRPGFYRMLRDVVRFYQAAPDLAFSGVELGTADYLDREGYSPAFADLHLLPMISALWSSSLAQARRFPVRNLTEFMHGHGMLRLRGRPQWLCVRGGSTVYVDALCRQLRNRPVLNSPVRQVAPEGEGVRVRTDALEETFDHVVIACHADQALRMRNNPGNIEREVLDSISYRSNTVTLHTDVSLLPRRRRAWGCWNYRVTRESGAPPLVTYNLNLLQGLADKRTYCVTLNGDDRIDQNTVLGRYAYAHPQFDRASFAAQKQWDALQGKDRVWYCGAWWGYGFHEDGVRSAVRVARALGVAW
ncbi:MAG TPA: FAD-dependent oxidoreductase [Gammaproteobacteria bacterium]|nr:FAD-dependent oxidoreductase [Gammaproteobacteria bacterium]